MFVTTKICTYHICINMELYLVHNIGWDDIPVTIQVTKQNDPLFRLVGKGSYSSSRHKPLTISKMLSENRRFGGSVSVDFFHFFQCSEKRPKLHISIKLSENWGAQITFLVQKIFWKQKTRKLQWKERKLLSVNARMSAWYGWGYLFAIARKPTK